MNSVKKLLLLCGITISSGLFGMENENLVGRSKGTADSLRRFPGFFLPMMGPLGSVISGAITVGEIAHEHNEVALAASTWLMWHKLRQMQNEPRKKSKKHKKISVYNITVPEKGSKEEVEKIITELGKKTELDTKARKKISQLNFKRSPKHREYLGDLAEGLEAANMARLFSCSSHTVPYIGVSKIDFKESDFWDPGVVYFGVAVANADMNQAQRYINRQFKDTKVRSYIKQQVPEEVRYGASRIIAGAGAVALTTAKYNYMSPEELMTSCAADIAVHFAREQAGSAANNRQLNNAFDSFAEAAQRQPYLTTAVRQAGYEVLGKGKQEGLNGATSALVNIGANAGVRFVIKEASYALDETEIAQSFQETVPLPIRDALYEGTVAGVMVGGNALVKYCGDSCCLQ